MSRKEILLAFIILFAMASGVLAINAQKINGNLFCTSVQGGYCDDTTYTQNFNGNLMYCTTKKDDCMNITSQTRVVQDPR